MITPTYVERLVVKILEARKDSERNGYGIIFREAMKPNDIRVEIMGQEYLVSIISRPMERRVRVEGESD